MILGSHQTQSEINASSISLYLTKMILQNGYGMVWYDRYGMDGKHNGQT